VQTGSVAGVCRCVTSMTISAVHTASPRPKGMRLRALTGCLPLWPTPPSCRCIAGLRRYAPPSDGSTRPGERIRERAQLLTERCGFLLVKVDVALGSADLKPYRLLGRATPRSSSNAMVISVATSDLNNRDCGVRRIDST